MKYTKKIKNKIPSINWIYAIQLNLNHITLCITIIELNRDT